MVLEGTQGEVQTYERLQNIGVLTEFRAFSAMSESKNAIALLISASLHRFAKNLDELIAIPKSCLSVKCFVRYLRPCLPSPEVLSNAKTMPPSGGTRQFLPE